jgi:hypothetical protein
MQKSFNLVWECNKVQEARKKRFNKQCKVKIQVRQKLQDLGAVSIVKRKSDGRVKCN